MSNEKANLEKAQDTVTQFEAELMQAVANLDMEPTSANAGAVHIAELKLTAAKRALANARANMDQAAMRINSTDYKTAIKRLAAIEIEADKQTEIVLAQVNEVYQAIDVLEDLAKERYRLCKKFEISKPGFNEKGRFRRIWDLEGKLIKWLKDYRAYEIGNPPAAPIKHNYTREQERALKERYHPADELNAMLARQWAKDNRGDDLN